MFWTKQSWVRSSVGSFPLVCFHGPPTLGSSLHLHQAAGASFFIISFPSSYRVSSAGTSVTPPPPDWHHLQEQSFALLLFRVAGSKSRALCVQFSLGLPLNTCCFHISGGSCFKERVCFFPRPITQHLIPLRTGFCKHNNKKRQSLKLKATKTFIFFSSC